MIGIGRKFPVGPSDDSEKDKRRGFGWDYVCINIPTICGWVNGACPRGSGLSGLLSAKVRRNIENGQRSTDYSNVFCRIRTSFLLSLLFFHKHFTQLHNSRFSRVRDAGAKVLAKPRNVLRIISRYFTNSFLPLTMLTPRWGAERRTPVGE